MSDLYHRTPVDARALANLIKGGFLDELAAGAPGGRKELLNQTGRLPRKRRGDHCGEVQKELPSALRAGVGGSTEAEWWSERPQDDRIAALPYPPDEEARMQRGVLSVDVLEHPLRPYRQALKGLKVTPARKVREMPAGSRARAAGIMECLQSPPTRSGRPVYFLLVEDQSGLLQATIFDEVYRSQGHHLYRAGSFLLEGIVEQDEKRGFAFVVDSIDDLSRHLPAEVAGERRDAGSGALLRAGRPPASRTASRRSAG